MPRFGESMSLWVSTVASLMNSLHITAYYMFLIFLINSQEWLSGLNLYIVISLFGDFMTKSPKKFSVHSAKFLSRKSYLVAVLQEKLFKLFNFQV